MSERPAPSVPPGDASTHQPTVLNQPTSQSTNQPTNVNPPSISMNSSNSSTSSSTNQPTPSLSQLKQQIVRELLILHQCYSRLNHDRGEPHRFMSFVHSLFALLPPELQLTEAEALAVDEFVSPNSSPYTPVASITFMQNLPTVDVSRCPELSCEDCPVCQEPFSSQSTLTQRRVSPMPQSINQSISQSFIQPVSQSTNQPINPSPSQDPRVIELPCEHIFHYQCVATWMSTHNTCPCCRFKLPTDNTRYNETVIRRQAEPVKRNRALKRKASEITSTNHESPIPAKRFINQSINQSAPVSRCALSTHGLPCLLPINQSTHQSVIEHLSCGHSFHSQCLRTALALLGVATLQPDIGPCPLCCLHSASPDSTARLQRMTLPFITNNQNISQLTNQSSSQSSNQSREPSPSPVRYSRPQH